MLYYTSIDVFGFCKKISEAHTGLWKSLVFASIAYFCCGMAQGLYSSIWHYLKFCYDMETCVHNTDSEYDFYKLSMASGITLGAFLFGYILRRFGRVATIQGCMLTIAICECVHTVSFDIPLLLPVRTTIDTANTILELSIVYYLVELFPKNTRAMAVAMAFSSGELGKSVVHAIACIRNIGTYRVQFLSCAALSILGLIVSCKLPEESPRWHIQHGREQLAHQIIMRSLRVTDLKAKKLIAGLKPQMKVSVRNNASILICTFFIIQTICSLDNLVVYTKKLYNIVGYFTRLSQITALVHLVSGTLILAMSVAYERLQRLGCLYISLFLIFVTSVLILVSHLFMAFAADVHTITSPILFFIPHYFIMFHIIGHSYGLTHLPQLLLAECVPLSSKSFNIAMIYACGKGLTTLIFQGLHPSQTSDYLSVLTWILQIIASAILMPVPLPLFLPETSGLSLAKINISTSKTSKEGEKRDKDVTKKKDNIENVFDEITGGQENRMIF